MARPLTVTEVAALADAEEKTVRKEVEYGLFGDESPPRFGLSAVVYFRVLSRLEVHLRVEDRKKVYAAISKALTRSSKPNVVELTPLLNLKLGPITREVREKLQRFEAWKKKIVSAPEILGGEPVFPETRLAVRHVGGLALKGAVDELCEDYPALKPEDIELARLYTVAYPRIGRPRERQAAVG